MDYFYSLATAYWEIPAWGSVNLIDAIWTAIGILSMVNILWSISPVYQDWKNSTGILNHIAFGYFRREIIRLGQGIAVLSIGVYACIQTPIHNFNIITPAGIALTAGLVVIGVGIGLQSFLDKRLRLQLLHYLEEQENIRMAVQGEIVQTPVLGDMKVDVDPKQAP